MDGGPFPFKPLFSWVFGQVSKWSATWVRTRKNNKANSTLWSHGDL